MPSAATPATIVSIIRTAMVLAAGLGTRMRPLTATRPKPLVEVAGKPLLDHVLDRLRTAGIKRAVVNIHYLGDMLVDHLKRDAPDLEIVISDERDVLLETGGGILRALPLIEDETFLVVNSDNLWVDGPTEAIRLLADRWDESAMDALLLVVPLAKAHCHQGVGDFRLDPHGRLSRRAPGKPAPFVYTGIQIVSRRLFRDAPAGPFSLNLLWNRALAEERVYGLVHEGLWFDVGTPPAVARTEAILGLS